MKLKGIFIPLFLTFTGWLLSFDAPPNPNPDTKDFVVVLDAGHGGHDPGNLGNGYLEKNISLSIVIKVGQLLEAQGIKVVYTRKDDSFVDLYVRGEIANKADADLFVSVHCDSHDSDAHGAGTFVLGLHANNQNFEIAKKENSVIYLEDNYESRYAAYDIDSPESIIGLTIMQEEFLDQSIMLAKMMQDNFSTRLERNDRKVKQAGFIVLHQTFMPSVLVETGFLTNKAEGSYLNSSRGQTDMGKAIADAILLYRENISPTQTVTRQATDPVAVRNSGEAVSLGEDRQEVSEEVKPAAADEAPVVAVSPVVSEKPEKEVSEPQPGISTGEQLNGSGKLSDEARALAAENKEIAELASEGEGSVKKPGASARIEFKIQLMASSKDVELKPENFNGLGMLTKEAYKNLFRYLYGSTTIYSEAKKIQSTAKRMGYDTAFIVAYKDGERISVPEALNYVSD